MTRMVINYILLFLVIVLSFSAIRSYEFYPKGSYTKALDFLRWFTPCVLFSFYLVFLQRCNYSIGKLMLLFCALILLYAIVFETGLASWGAALPMVGGLGAYGVKKLFYPGELYESTDRRYLIGGGFSGTIGLLLFYLGQDYWVAGVGFGVIIMIWQLTIGLIWNDQVDN